MPDDSWTKPDTDKLLKEVLRIAEGVSDPKVLAQVAEAEAQIKAAEEACKTPYSGLRDMPETVLDGRFGDICHRSMALFPLSYSWPSLLTVASAMVPRHIDIDTKFNLYTALVGPVHSGKSQAIEWAQKLLGIGPPELLDTMAGSAEGLIKTHLNCLGAPRLLSPDELAHLLSKAQILNASFSSVLCRALYMDKFDLVLGKGQTTTFHASLSILGGLIDEKFQDLFASASTAGWYDRFIFGQCPDGFLFDYQPFFGKPQKLSPCAVSIDSEVWTEKAMWLRQEPEMTARVAELAIRAAAICASFDQRRVLYAKDLGPALEFARYQTRIRAVLKPNPGENFEGKIAYKILDYLARYQGKFVSKRTMMLAIHANRYGPTTAARCFDVLCSNGEIESTKVGKCELVRLTPENHPLPVVLPPEAE